METEYTIIGGQRVLVGLSACETAEFERLDALIPLNAKPVWPDTMNSPAEERWRELYTKHDIARQAPHRRFGRASAEARVCNGEFRHRDRSVGKLAAPGGPAVPRLPGDFIDGTARDAEGDGDEDR